MPPGRDGETYFYLLIRPRVHAQRLHLGNMSAELPVQGSASHAEKDTQLH